MWILCQLLTHLIHCHIQAECSILNTRSPASRGGYDYGNITTKRTFHPNERSTFQDIAANNQTNNQTLHSRNSNNLLNIIYRRLLPALLLQPGMCAIMSCLAAVATLPHARLGLSCLLPLLRIYATC
ncbi:hypothetical protein V1525DRAFT_68389 [Lipomyces kononenkoae]|uniref:Uncharacterized protein n=1 Tax=Lipomyces kononenkoae TaxID=34357 RepID=A0ACC3T4W9_LIPKO